MDDNAYLEACRGLSRAKIPYVIVGAFGVNLYAEEVGAVILTVDCDLLLPARTETLSKTLKVLRKLGYAFEAGGEPLVDETPDLLKNIVRARACITARRKDARLDLALEIAGCRFEALWKRHRRFRIRGQTVRVAPLADLLRSKALADRPKDRLFLETYRDALGVLLTPRRRKTRNRK